MSYPLVAKERIPSQLFKEEDVIQNHEERNERLSKLKHAFQSNRRSYSKARIVFDTTGETLTVIDNVWEITDKNVLLKGGITLPISSIREVTIFNVKVSKEESLASHSS
jgi:mRNA-degrading endonuclease HigB of HigAB toxin-antitoxin module